MRRALLIVTLLAGCGPGSYADFDKQVVHLYCQHAVDCGFADASYLSQCEANQGVASLYDPATLKVSYDSHAGKSCLDALAGALAADCVYGASLRVNVGTACDHVVTGTVATGSPCKTGVECVPGDDCAFVSTGPMMCTATCQPTTFGVGTPGDVGAPCRGMMGNTPCKPGLFCLPSPDYLTGTCGPPPAAGAACFPSQGDNRTCASGLVCDPSLAKPVCIPEKQKGEPCNTADECAARLLCVGPSTGTSVGTCQPPVASGGACSASSGVDPCVLPAVCANGVCAPPPRVGQPCTGECLDGYCDFTTTTPTCKAFVPLGGACNPNQSIGQCGGSATCNATSKTCVPLAFCM